MLFRSDSRRGRGVIVFAGGLLQASSSYSISGGEISFRSPINAEVMVCAVRHHQQSDSGTEIRRFSIHHYASEYPMPDNVSPKANVFNWLGGLMQYSDEYTINDGILRFRGHQPRDAQYARSYLLTGTPRSRLVTRQELEAYYLSTLGGHMTGAITSSASLADGNSLVSKAYVDALIAQLRRDFVGSRP